MGKKNQLFGNGIEAISYAVLLLLLVWSIYLLENFYPNEFIQLGILPQKFKGLKGIFLAPLIHSPTDVSHLLNNSLPAAILLASIVYYYREIAFKIILFSWLLSGFFVWAFAQSKGYHIGFSGLIYAFAGFLFTSGILRKFRPLQGISLFVVFVYGSMIWGIFPSDEPISWEGHLSGLVVGVVLAFVYRKEGPQAPKYQYEIEKELGIETPDLEGIYLENQRLAQEEQNRVNQENLSVLFGEQARIQYDYKPKLPQDESLQ